MKNLRTQNEIMASWKADAKTPLVSICCAAYNHESYIEDTLEGFLIQKTEFPFEILIHDDASTDKTADIIREYEAKYPQIIKPIYQTENQYSQGKSSFFDFVLPRALGKYIALCEGDDYWIDKNKLKTQIEILTGDTNISIVFHKAKQIDFQQNREEIICCAAKTDGFIEKKECVYGRGPFMPTASIVFRGDLIEDLINFFNKARPPVGDFFIQIISSYKGRIYYINSTMSVYRKNHAGSFTESYSHKKTRNKHSTRMLKAIDQLIIFLAGHNGLFLLSSPYVYYKYNILVTQKNKLHDLIGLLSIDPRNKPIEIVLFYYVYLIKKLLIYLRYKTRRIVKLSCSWLRNNLS